LPQIELLYVLDVDGFRVVEMEPTDDNAFDKQPLQEGRHRPSCQILLHGHELALIDLVLREPLLAGNPLTRESRAVFARSPSSCQSVGQVSSISRGIRLSRDSWVSVMYPEGLHSAKSSGTSQRTDRHQGIVGQKRSRLQCNSYIRAAERPGALRSVPDFQKQCASSPPGDQAPRRLP
jgi:hypothetical protein